jgi:hypothetical protein
MYISIWESSKVHSHTGILLFSDQKYIPIQVYYYTNNDKKSIPIQVYYLTNGDIIQKIAKVHSHTGVLLYDE